MASKNGLSNSEKLVGSLKNLGDAGRVMVSEGGGKLLGRGTGMAGKTAGAVGGGATGVLFRVTEAIKNTTKAHPVLALLATAFAGIKIFQHFRNKNYAKGQIAEHAQAAQAMDTMATMGVNPEQAAALQQVAAMGVTPEMLQLAQMQQQMGGVPSSLGSAGQTDWVGRVANQRQNEQMVGAGRRQ